MLQIPICELFATLKEQKISRAELKAPDKSCVGRPQCALRKKESTKQSGGESPVHGLRLLAHAGWVSGWVVGTARYLWGWWMHAHKPPFTCARRRRLEERSGGGAGRAAARPDWRPSGMQAGEADNNTPAGEPEWVSVERAFRFAWVSGSTAGTRAAAGCCDLVDFKIRRAAGCVVHVVVWKWPGSVSRTGTLGWTFSPRSRTSVTTRTTRTVFGRQPTASRTPSRTRPRTTFSSRLPSFRVSALEFGVTARSGSRPHLRRTQHWIREKFCVMFRAGDC